MISFALESPGFESHADISLLCRFNYYCETTETVDENRDL